MSEMRQLHRQYSEVSTEGQNSVTVADNYVPSSSSGVQATASTDEPAPKRRCLFKYKRLSGTSSVDHEGQMSRYLASINSPDFSFEKPPSVIGSCEFAGIRPLFAKIFSIPASSAPVERVFSQSGLIMKPNRAKMSDTLLESLVYLKCN